MNTSRKPDDFLDQPDPFVVQINTPDAQGRTPLRQAAFGDDPEMVSALLRSGANPNLPDGQGKTPLQHARSGDVAIALIAGGADLEVRDREGRTPLHNAVHDPLYFAHGANYANRDLTHTLLTSGADVNAQDNEGRTPLHLTQDPTTASNLVKAGADVGIQDSQNRLPTDGALHDKVGAIHGELFVGVTLPERRGFEAIYSALDAPTEQVAPRPPRTRQRP
jgi:ankyrin repeat protein